MPRVTLSVEAIGLDETIRALRNLPEQVEDEIQKAREDLAEKLARYVKAAGRASDRQSARAARTVRATGGDTPTVIAGPHPLLFGSEFGANARYGWYRAGRYHRSSNRQFRTHIGAVGYWFQPTIRANQPTIDAAWEQATAAILRRWGA
jgi:hypothetical protein